MLELIEQSESFCKKLEKQAEIELNFCIDTSIMLERLSWELLRITNDLKTIKDYKGGYCGIN